MFQFIDTYITKISAVCSKSYNYFENKIINIFRKEQTDDIFDDPFDDDEAVEIDIDTIK